MCIIYHGSQFSIYWQIIVTLLLLFVCVVLPLHIAFGNNTRNWCIAYSAIDFVFLLDLIMNFFLTVAETDTTNEISGRREIAEAYLKGWFAVDLLSILPFDKIMKFAQGHSPGQSFCENEMESGRDNGLNNTNLLFRGPKIGKVFRIVRLLRLVKIFKLMKNKEHL